MSNINNNGKKKKNVKIVEVEIHADSKEDAMRQIKDHLRKAADEIEATGTLEDHRGHGCDQDPEVNEMLGSKKILKEVKFNAEELKLIKEMEAKLKDLKALKAQFDLLEEESKRDKAKLFAMIRVRSNDFKTEGIFINREKGVAEFFEQAFKKNKN